MFLNIFEEISRQLSADKALPSLVLPANKTLKLLMEKKIWNYVLNNFSSKLKKLIEKWFDKFERNFTYSESTSLDPRLKFSASYYEETFLEIINFIISNNFGSDIEN